MKLRVRGMSCEHCARSVRQAVKRVAPDAVVRIDLASGTIEIDGAFDRQAVEAAIREAGFAVIGAEPAAG